MTPGQDQETHSVKKKFKKTASVFSGYIYKYNFKEK